jgi:hypothetical protein
MLRRRFEVTAILAIATVLQPGALGIATLLYYRGSLTGLDAGEGIITGAFLTGDAFTDSDAGNDNEHEHGAFPQHRCRRWTIDMKSLGQDSLRWFAISGQYFSRDSVFARISIA